MIARLRRITQDDWQELVDAPLAVAALIFLAAYSYEVLANPDATGVTIAEVIIWLTWVVFVIDYTVNLWLAERRWHWMYTHLLDLAAVVLPMFRPLRLLRLVSLVSMLNRTVGEKFRGQVVVYVAGASVLLIYVSALAMVDAERGHDGGIQDLGQAIWWAFVTVTTVGYGDYFPVTAEGRLIAVAVMISGITLIGVVTATFASWIVEKVSVREEAEEQLTRKEIEELGNEIAALRKLIEDRVVSR